MRVTNPRNNKRYSVPFLVFDDERQPILGYQTSVQMNLIQVQRDNFDVVAARSTQDAFAEVYDKKLGKLPGTQHRNVRAGAIPVVMANRRVPIAVRPKLKMKLERLKENPLEWSVDDVARFIENTECAHMSRILREQEIDGQALLLLNLPTVQEHLELKLGPAVKLCHHIERVKVAFFTQSSDVAGSARASANRTM
ncbi:PREDICTED: polyhomeotic-like protein 2 [Priapulus caudatus]|uniref:Polyhomeotic-like protein 2 n=1 Tax=Priapulus caudatus TaxID=37621 RepID=A0ABM1EMG9_PRICU|nr:PREDICTED: polyhomeotic-like protein 2 [Priapulus caudatus]